MAMRKRSHWMGTVAQAAVFALLFQILVGASGCPSETLTVRSASVTEVSAAGGVVVCSSLGAQRQGVQEERGSHQQGPLKGLHSDCGLCLSHMCCPSALAPPEDAAFFAPSTMAVAFAIEAWRNPSSADVFSLRNRGPPPPFSA